ncbi:MAG: Hsp20/alpha crystallin family protein [Nitrospirota bacterium]
MKNMIRWEPFQPLRRFDPFQELRSMQQEMDRIFNRALGVEPSHESGIWMPAAESFIREGNLVFRAELPGVDPKHLDVSVTDRELIVKGERKQEKSTQEGEYGYQEIMYGSFERRFSLPEGAHTEDLKATYSNGILEITIPAPAVSKARKIEIETSKEEKEQIEGRAKKAA